MIRAFERSHSKRKDSQRARAKGTASSEHSQRGSGGGHHRLLGGLGLKQDVRRGRGPAIALHTLGTARSSAQTRSGSAELSASQRRRSNLHPSQSAGRATYDWSVQLATRASVCV